jgi:beta-lactamase class A
MDLESFLSTNHSESLNQFNKYSSKLREKADKLKTNSINTETGMLFNDLGNMIETYIDQSQSAVSAKRGRNVDEYNTRYNEASKLYGYINSYIDNSKSKPYQYS